MNLKGTWKTGHANASVKRPVARKSTKNTPMAGCYAGQHQGKQSHDKAPVLEEQKEAAICQAARAARL